MARCCDFTNTVDQQFTGKKAGQELEHYRRKGAGPTTRLLIDGISQAGVMQGTLLDVGAGIGALTFELLERGFDRAVIVEASAGYTATASGEAVCRSRATVINVVCGDFVEVAVPCRWRALWHSIVSCAAIRFMKSSSTKRSATRSADLRSPTRELVGTSEWA